jgi:hypothetical protein
VAGVYVHAQCLDVMRCCCAVIDPGVFHDLQMAGMVPFVMPPTTSSGCEAQHVVWWSQAGPTCAASMPRRRLHSGAT